MRVLLLLAIVATSPRVRAQSEVEPPTGRYEPPPKNDPPRWRIRSSLLQGVGGGIGGPRAASFPTTLEVGARLWGPLSVSVAGLGIFSARESEACGAAQRPNAAIGTLGVRADLFNHKSASWLDPFVEIHAGVGGQAAFPASGTCGGPHVFASGGARIGFDAWLGRVAVTAQLSYDYLPVAAPLAFSIGASFLLY